MSGRNAWYVRSCRTSTHYNNIAVRTCVEIVGVGAGWLLFPPSASHFHLRFAYSKYSPRMYKILVQRALYVGERE